MAERENILFVVIDQLRADCVFGALEGHVNLPNIRGLASDAMRFDRHYSVTNPCGPSRASILTGQYAMNHRSIRNGTPLRHDTPNLATELARRVLRRGSSAIPTRPRTRAPIRKGIRR